MKEWQSIQLNKVASINYGHTESASREAVGPRFLRITDIKDDGVDWESVPFCKIESGQLPKYTLKTGDIVFTRTGATTGKSFLIRNPPTAVFASYLIRLRLQSEPLTPEFVSYYFQTPEYWKFIGEGSAGSAQGGFNASKLGALLIPAPPPHEQCRIVALLDEAFEALATAKANAEQNLQNARALFESHLASVFSQRGEEWVEMPLAELCDIKHGYAFDGQFFSREGDYVLLTPGNFCQQGGYRDRGEKQKYFIGEIPQEYILREGDLLVAMTEQAAGLLGSPILVPESGKFLHNQRLGLVQVKPGIPWTNEFFFHVFNTRHVRDEIHSSASGVKVRHTSPSKIGDVLVSFPASIDEQMNIVSTLSSLSVETQRLTSIYERKLAALEELKTSLLHQTFNGEL